MKLIKTRRLKRFSKSFIALALVMSFIITNSIGVKASELPNFNLESYEDLYSQEELEHLDKLLDLAVSVDSSEEESLKELFENISPEAKSLFLEYLAYDETMLKTYNTYVDPQFKPEAIDSTTAMRAATPTNTQILSTLSASLYALGLTETTVAAFVAVAAEILVATVAITAAIILAALVAYAAHEIIVGNWTEISGKWTQIKDAFASAFTSKVSSSTMSSAFSSANTTYQTDFITATRNALPNIARGYGNLKCVEAANAMRSFLLSRNQRGEIVILRFPGAVNGIVVCKSYMGGNEAISYTGMHQGVLYQGLVYDNLHPYGLPMGTWINDFETAVPIAPTVQTIPF